MRAGCYDVYARLADMDTAGILASLNFPSFPRFCGQLFYEVEDKDLALSCLEAWNDWMLEDWCGAAPGRFIPMTLFPLWDPALAAREIERCAQKGSRAVAFSENPTQMLGLPSVYSDYWDPVWSSVQDNDLVVCMHQGSSSHRILTGPDTPQIVTMTWNIGVQMSGAMLDWIYSGIFERFPKMRFALSEGGIRWIPYFLERAEQTLDKQRFWAAKSDKKYNIHTGEVQEGKKLGVDLLSLNIRETFREHIFGCFIEDVAGIA